MVCNNICFWTWSRAFLISITLLSLCLVTFQYVEFNKFIEPLPLVGLIINCTFLVLLLIGVTILIKLFVGLLVIYALILVILIISAQSSPGLINFHVSTSNPHTVNNELTLSVKALLLLGLSWFLVGGQIIGSMLYLNELSGYLHPLDQFAANRLNNSDSYIDGHDSGDLKLGWPSITGLSTGSTYREFGSTDSWNLPCSCHHNNNKSEASSSDTSKPFKWPISPNKQSIQHQSQHDLHQLSITI